MYKILDFKSRHLYLTLFLLSLIGLMPSCNQSMSSQELITSLRVIGAMTQPIAKTVSSIEQGDSDVLATFITIIPNQETLTENQSYQDPFTTYNLMTNQEILSQTAISFTDYTIYEIQTQMTLPGPDLWPENSLSNFGYIPVRFGWTLKTSGEVENSVGNYLITQDDSLIPNFQQHVITITSPTPGSIIDTTPLTISAEITNTNNERYKLGWYTTNGSVNNRRQMTTTLTDHTPGTLLLIVTARGLESGAFAYQALEYVVNP